MHITTKTNETNTKNKSFKKPRCLCNGKVIIMYVSISKCFIICLTIQFGPGQECAKCDQIATLNKTAAYFITLTVFLSLYCFKNVYNFYFIHLRSDSRQYLQQQHLNSQPFVLWSKLICQCSPIFQFHLLFINAITVLLSIIIYSWGKYLLFIKLLTVHNNYLQLIKIFTVHNNYLPLIKLFTVNNNCLPLIEIFAVNKTIYL